MNKLSTDKFDISGKEIFDGDTLEYIDIEGKTNRFIVKWSNYWKSFIGDAYGEIYDLSSDYFCKATKLD
jgi:hypothetical protein